MRAILASGVLFAIGCTGGVATVDVAEEGLTTADAVARAEEWVTNQLQYCQAAYGQTDYDQACWSMPWEQNDRCYRHSNAAWNPYRSDCSGLVSYAWGLAAPGRTTYGFYPYQTDITKAIQGTDLQAGDALNNADHVMLFKEWVTKGSKAVEEPGCSTTRAAARGQRGQGRRRAERVQWGSDRPVATGRADRLAIARRIGTYETSMKPYDDCCSLFVPEHPETRAKPDDVLACEAKLDVDALADACAASVTCRA